MATRVLLEICVDSLDHAVAAEAAGADRIELCHDLSCGGLTPSTELMRTARQRLRIPIHGMIRPRPGNFRYTGDEFETMKRDIGFAKEVGLNGLVLGLLDSTGQIDRKRTAALIQLAHPLPVTFHRAFDECPDLIVALEAVITAGAKRILTSGGNSNAADGHGTLSKLITTAGDRVVIMPGGGVRSENADRILRSTGATEIHTSLGLSDPRSRSARDIPFFAEEVRRFKQTLDAKFSA